MSTADLRPDAAWMAAVRSSDGPEQGRSRQSADPLPAGEVADRPQADHPSVGGGALDRRAVQALQGAAGNAAVSRLIAQRLRQGPATDPKFARVRGDVRAGQRRISAHKPAGSEAAAAHAASKAPADDKLAQAKVAQSGDMAAAKPAGFDKAKFIAAVNAAIAAQAPKNLDEADKFADKPSGPPGEVTSQVAAGKQQSASAIAGATDMPPDQGRAKVTPDVPLTPDHPPDTPTGPNPADAVPDKAPASATDFSAGPKEVSGALAAEQITPHTLDTSNEPSFLGARGAQADLVQHSATAPGQVRGHEDALLGKAKQAAASQGGETMSGLHNLRVGAGGHHDAAKHTQQGADEAKRAEVTGKLQKVFDTCKTDVEKILADLDKKVDDQFAREEKTARDAFTADYTRRVKAYKDKRYGGMFGFAKWAKDKLLGLPDEVNAFYAQARTIYTTRMQQVISNVADTIGTELGKAKQRIAAGRSELQAAINQLPKDQQAIARQAAEGFTAQFDELTSTVDAKGEELVQTLATKYTEALKAVDDQIQKEKDKNRGLAAKAMDAVGGVIKTILELKNMLLGILSKAAHAVMAILKDPIGFVSHLFAAIGTGLHNFITNIGTHLNKGLVGWLLGALTGAGLTLPGKFDLPGILLMVASLLGLTWTFIRGRIIAKGVPDQAVAAVEKAAPLAAELKSGGPAAITKSIAGRVGDLKAGLWAKITGFLIPTVLVAGITWLLSLLTPASAFVKAAKAIIDVITFVITRGAQIAAFVNAVLDAVIAIAAGATGGVPALIENALAVSIPVLIGLLAALLGISGIADKVKKIFQALSKPVMKAIDWIVTKIVGLAKKLWNKLKRAAIRRRDRGQAGVDDSLAGKRGRLERAVAEVKGLANHTDLGLHLSSQISVIRQKYRLSLLEATKHEGVQAWKVRAKVNPEADFELYSIHDQADELRREIAEVFEGGISSSTEYAPVTLADIMHRCKPVTDEAKKQGYKLEWRQVNKISWVLYISHPSLGGRISMVGEVRKRVNYKETGETRKHPSQTEFVDDSGNRYALDQLGQKVPRHVVRNITANDEETLKADQGISRKGLSMPLWQHVKGASKSKREAGRSPYISATKFTDGAITNPQGRAFRSELGAVRIDLLMVARETISDLTTGKGQKEWLFVEKNKQLIEDAARTQEIAILREVPQDAIVERL